MKRLRAFISLNEAVTWLAFGAHEMRSPNNEVAMHITEQRELIKLIDRCVHEAETSSKYRDFPRQLPYNPRSALIEQLDACRSSWPPSAEKLHSTAVKQESKWSRYDKKYHPALSAILDAAANNRIELVGQTAPMAGAKVSTIPRNDLLGQVTIDYQRRHLGPDITANESARPYAILKAGPGLQVVYYNVLISRRQFQDEFAESIASIVPQVHSEIHAKIREWYKQRIATWPKDKPPPSREGDLKEARRLFKDVKKLRPLLRALRKELAPPEWTKKGRRKSAAK